jgi:hypothetical protein
MENIDDEKTCRFCLESTTTEKNQLVSPCNCKGSIEYIHTKCLLRWRISNLNNIINNCSICKSYFNIPLFLNFENTKIITDNIVNFMKNGFLFFILFNYIFIILMKIVKWINTRQMIDFDTYIENGTEMHNYMIKDIFINEEDNVKKCTFVYNIIVLLLCLSYNILFSKMIYNVKNKKVYFKTWIDYENIRINLLITTSALSLIYYYNHFVVLLGLITVTLYPLLMFQHEYVLKDMNRNLIREIREIRDGEE